MIAALYDNDAFRADGLLDRVQSFVPRVPALAPDGERSSARKSDSDPAASSPGSQAVPEVIDEARQRLEQVQKCGEGAQSQLRRARSAAERSAGGARNRLPERDEDREDGERQSKEERCPQNAERGESGECGDREVPLRHRGQRRERTLRGLVDGLEWRHAPDPVVDSPGAAGEREREAVPVNAPRPAHVSEGVVLRGPFALQQRLCFAVAPLLPPVPPDRFSAVVPHDRGRVEPDREALLVQPPADVDVVAGDAELRIEIADRLQR